MDGPLASIIINNYNYGRFLSEAIDSALGQTYPRVEVIVVDDGSTDNSREIIGSYGSRIIPVLKKNGGQASAFNAGFAASNGDIICFLDADDVFATRKVEEIVKARNKYPDAVLYYHRMQGINAQGNRMGRPWPLFLHTGCIREKVKQSGGWWPRPVTSALCFARRYLERVLPMPEEGFRLCADAYVADLAPFLGPVVGITGVLAFYRQHGQNYWGGTVTGDRRGIQRRAGQYVYEHQQLQLALSLMGQNVRIDLNRHLPYMMTAYYLNRKPSWGQVALLIMSCPVLGYISRVYQLARLVTGRV